MTILVKISLIFLLGGLLPGFFWTSFFSRPSPNAPTILLTIPLSATSEDVADMLKREGLLLCKSCYRFYARFDSAARYPRPGTYPLSFGMNYRALARQFAIGPAREEVEIKIIEGWSLADEAEALKSYGVDPSVFFQRLTVKAWKSEYDFLKPLADDATLEGYLFPDTYRVWKDQLPQGLIKKQLDRFATRTTRLRAETQKQGRVFHDVITLASIVEKEVAKPEDRKVVAGIFWNRLRENMPLQSDATINYITRKGRTRPTLEELDVASPYNTYRNRGLPPGPISNPGIDALEAVVAPAQTAYRYFLTNENGTTYFARTFEEHIRNRQKAFGKKNY